MKDLSYENKFDLDRNELVGGTHFHMNGFARRFVLTQGQMATRKCLLAYSENVARHSVRHAREIRVMFLAFCTPCLLRVRV